MFLRFVIQCQGRRDEDRWSGSEGMREPSLDGGGRDEDRWSGGEGMREPSLDGGGRDEERW